MKKKLNSMGRVAIALVLALSLGLVMAAPVAADVSSATVTVVPDTAGDTAEYTIVFDITSTLAIGGTISVEFPPGTTVPTAYETGDVTVEGADISGGDVSGAAQVVTITLPTALSAPLTVDVVFKAAADIVNPPAGTYTLSVATSAEPTPVASEPYTIVALLPTVTVLEPDSGNVGDTMWVEVGGANFTGDSDTNASTTTLDFGAGITVVSTKYVLATSIDVQITINATGTPEVAATTAAGTGTVTATFTANAAGTPQVDVWLKYTPADTIFDSETLVFDATTTTITLGIAEATAGTSSDPQVIIVHADTYAESLNVNQDYVTIKSLSGADSTIIDGGSAANIVYVTADGVTIDGFTIKGDATTTSQRGIYVTASDVFTLQNNKLVDVANDNIFVQSSTGVPITDGLIDNNTITGLGSDAERQGIIVQSYDNAAIAGVTISDNTISDIGGDYAAIQLSEVSGEVSNIAVTGNTISNGTTGIKLSGNIAGLTGVYAIADNTITGQTDAGVTVASDSPVFDLENNIITGNFYGIELWTSTAAHTIKYNDISGNSAYGLLVPQSGATVNASYNWWGDISGPSSGSQLTAELWWSDVVSTALGSGDAMSRYVDTWDPWLTRDQATAVSDGIAYHGSAYPLAAGWNTLSVPLALDDAADTLDDIVALGDFIIATGTARNYDGGYYYDAAAGLWIPLAGTYEFKPGAAVYVKMLATADFPILYSGVFSLPSVSLPAGWNLIGSMFGVDPSDYGIEEAGTKTVDEALVSLGASASVVISPSMPGQTLAWATVATDGATNMIVGEGYWVFMTAPATLAGFEVTPIYWINLP